MPRTHPYLNGRLNAAERLGRELRGPRGPAAFCATPARKRAPRRTPFPLCHLVLAADSRRLRTGATRRAQVLRLWTGVRRVALGLGFRADAALVLARPVEAGHLALVLGAVVRQRCRASPCGDGQADPDGTDCDCCC